MSGIAVERSSPKKVSDFRTMKSILSNRVLEEPAPRLGTVKVNDDFTLLFKRDADSWDYRYVIGKASNGKKYIGIIPFNAVAKREEIANEVMRQFNIVLSDENINSGWLRIDNKSIFMHGYPAILHENDHTLVKRAIINFLPEIDNFTLLIEQYPGSAKSESLMN